MLDYECVIVPGLGGFMTHHVEARYDEADNTFLPPLRTLGFNPKLKLNDSLLAQSYVEAYDISYPEAVNRIEEEVNELKQHIQNEGSYELTDIGVISLNEDGNYEFEPCEAGVLTPWLYGLCSFEMKMTAEGKAANAATPKDDVPAGNNDAMQEAPTQARHALDATGEADDDKVIRIKVAWIRNAVAIAAAVIAFFAITPPISNSYQNHANFGSLPQAIMSANILDDAQQNATGSTSLPKPLKLKASVDSARAKAKAEARMDQAADSVITAPQKDLGRYCIVLASRITQRNADAFVSELHKEGWKDADVYINNDIVRVVYGHFQNESDAYDTLRNIRNNKYFEQAWVYKKR